MGPVAVVVRLSTLSNWHMLACLLALFKLNSFVRLYLNCIQVEWRCVNNKVCTRWCSVMPECVPTNGDTHTLLMIHGHLARENSCPLHIGTWTPCRLAPTNCEEWTRCIMSELGPKRSICGWVASIRVISREEEKERVATRLASPIQRDRWSTTETCPHQPTFMQNYYWMLGWNLVEYCVHFTICTMPTSWWSHPVAVCLIDTTGKGNVKIVLKDQCNIVAQL